MCGIAGVGRFTILAEPGSQRIPCLKPIDIMRKLNATIELQADGTDVMCVKRKDGHTSEETLSKLPSGHITNDYLNFDGD